ARDPHRTGGAGCAAADPGGRRCRRRGARRRPGNAGADPAHRDHRGGARPAAGLRGASRPRRRGGGGGATVLMPRGRHSRQALRAATEEREEALRGLCFCLLYDLCAWLTRARRPIPADVREYRLQAPRHLADPVARMRLYLNPELLALWERALAPFIDSGVSLSLELGEAAPLGGEGLERGDGGVRAELRFSEQ